MRYANCLKLALVRLRIGSPWALRRLYRIARSIAPAQSSRNLPPELVNNCRLIASRHDLLEWLPRDGRVAELGTYKGEFAHAILSRNSPKELHVIDIDHSHIDTSLHLDDRVTSHLGLSHEIIAKFPNEYFDWVYIDADHSYDGVLRDAVFSADKVKPGGFLVFNDFAHIDPMLGRYGVHRAVVEFMLENKWQMRFFAFDSNALYDVAIQKPA